MSLGEYPTFCPKLVLNWSFDTNSNIAVAIMYITVLFLNFMYLTITYIIQYIAKKPNAFPLNVDIPTIEIIIIYFKFSLFLFLYPKNIKSVTDAAAK